MTESIHSINTELNNFISTVEETSGKLISHVSLTYVGEDDVYEMTLPYIDNQFKLSPEKSNVLKEYKGELVNSVMFSDEGLEKTGTCYSWLHKNGKGGLVFEITASVSMTISPDVFNEIAILLDRSDVDPQDIFKIQLSPDITGTLDDATCFYKVTDPTTIYSNITSVEEYAKRVANNSEKTIDEIVEQDEYITHFHPSKEYITDISHILLQLVSVSAPSCAQLDLHGTIHEDGTVDGTLKVYIPVAEYV